MLKENLFLVRVGGEWLLDLHVKLFVPFIFREFKTCLNVVDSEKKTWMKLDQCQQCIRQKEHHERGPRVCCTHFQKA